MTPTQAFNEDQRSRWNGTDGEYWTSNQDRLDRTALAPVMAPLVHLPRRATDRRCLTSVAVRQPRPSSSHAWLVLPDESSVSISPAPMLSLAAERLGQFANTTCLLGVCCQGWPLRDLGAELISFRVSE